MLAYNNQIVSGRGGKIIGGPGLLRERAVRWIIFLGVSLSIGQDRLHVQINFATHITYYFYYFVLSRVKNFLSYTTKTKST